MNKQNKKKIIFICNHASFFVSHRFNLVEICIKNQIDCELYIGQGASKKNEKVALDFLKLNKIDYKIFNFHTSSNKIVLEILSFIKIFRKIYLSNPNLIHGISIKPIIFTLIISFFLKIKCVLSFSGFGYLYISKKNLIYRKLYETILKIFFIKKKYFNIIVQNNNDFNYLIKKFNIKNDKITKIKGSGIDLNKFINNKNVFKENIILFPSRPIISKGVNEFCEVACILKKIYPNWRFVIVGDIDYQSPDIIEKKTLKELVENNMIEFWGYEEDMIKVYKQAKLVCLPSYREGFPKVLMEAAASGIPTIISNDPGCVEAILPNKTGLVSPVYDTSILKNNIEKLMCDKDLYDQFSKESIKMAFERFDIFANSECVSPLRVWK